MKLPAGVQGRTIPPGVLLPSLPIRAKQDEARAKETNLFQNPNGIGLHNKQCNH
jgi:hypothetical protein